MQSHLLRAFIFALLLSSVVLAKSPAEIDFTAVDKIATAELAEKKTPGAVIAIIQDDKIVYTKAFGLANVETKAPMQPEMLFRLGSTTKMFTAAALVSLSEARKIKLTEPIGDKVKGLSPGLSKLTPHHLLSNSAGIRDFAPPFISQEDSALSTMVRSWKDDVFFADQGEIYSYSSPGFWLSGFVVEELAGKPYADAMDDLIFKPLEMNWTTLRPLVAMTYPLANGHNVTGNGPPVIIRPFYNNVAQWPAGSIFSNINDLSRFVIAFLNSGRLGGKQVMTSSLIEKMSAPHVPVPGESDSYYSYGLTNFMYRGMRFIAHGGFSRGYGSMIQMVPSRKFAVIVLTNKSGETMRKTVTRATELGLGLTPEQSTITATKPAPPDATESAEYVGMYVHAPATWQVFSKDGKLFLEHEGTEYSLTKTGERKFSFGNANEQELVFVPGKTGRIEFLFSELYSAKRVVK